MTYAPARLTLGANDLRTSDSATFSKNQERLARRGGGGLHQAFHSALREAPTIDYTTGDLRRLLTVCSALDAPSGSAAIQAVWARAADNAIAYSSTQGRRLANAVHFVNSLSFSHGEVAQASATAYGFSVAAGETPAGEANPVTDITPAVPAQLSDVEEWVLTSIVRGGSRIEHWTSVDLTITHNATNAADECFNGQLPFPVHVVSGGSRGGIAVSLTINGLDLATTLPTDGTIVLTLQNKQRGQVGLGSDEIELTIAPGLEDSDITDGSPSTRSITILAAHDGTNRPLTVTLP